MENLFERIVKTVPPPKPEDVLKLNELEKAKQGPDPSKPLPLKDLVLRWQQSQSPEDTSEILHQLRPTIRSAMTSYAPGMDKQLSIKAATLALDAMRTYDPSKGTDPATHAFHNLKRLSRLGTARTAILPQPEGARMELQRLMDISNSFEDDHGREPSVGELADMTGLNTRRIEKLLNGNTVINDTSSLSEESQESTFTQKDVTDEDYFEYVYSSVGPIDQKIMEWTSGMHGKPQLSNGMIASKLGISAAAVSQRKNKLLQMLSDVRSVL